MGNQAKCDAGKGQPRVAASTNGHGNSVSRKKWCPNPRGLAYLRKLVRLRFLRFRNGRANDFGTVKVLLIGIEHAFKASIPGS
jgi:hypothetical protein